VERTDLLPIESSWGDNFKPIPAVFRLTAKAACDYTERPEVTTRVIPLPPRQGEPPRLLAAAVSLGGLQYAQHQEVRQASPALLRRIALDLFGRDPRLARLVYQRSESLASNSTGPTTISASRPLHPWYRTIRRSPAGVHTRARSTGQPARSECATVPEYTAAMARARSPLPGTPGCQSPGGKCGCAADGSDKRKPLPWVATGCYPVRMVRRRSRPRIRLLPDKASARLHAYYTGSTGW